jgi:hypothetical protein
MSLIPLRAEPAIIKLRRSQSLKMPRPAGPGASVKSYSTTGVTKKVMISSPSFFTSHEFCENVPQLLLTDPQ